MIAPKEGHVYSIYHSRRGWEKLTVVEVSRQCVKLMCNSGVMKGQIRRMGETCWFDLVMSNRVQNGWAETAPTVDQKLAEILPIEVHIEHFHERLEAIAGIPGAIRHAGETRDEFLSRLERTLKPKEKPLKLRIVDIYCFDTTTKDLDAANRVIDKIEGHVTDKSDNDTVVDLLAAGKFVGALSAHNAIMVDEESKHLKFSDMEIRIVERAAV